MFTNITMRFLMLFCVLVNLVLLEIVNYAEAVRTSCPLGHYAILNANGDEVLACHRCRRCPPGLGVVRNCTATDNTVCEVCDIGTFSSTGSRMESCKPCRQCSAEDTLQECNPTTDTRCKKQCQRGFYYDPQEDKCTQCSYCFPDNIYAQTVRVEDCLHQNLPVNYQCSPLPSSQASSSWSPPIMVAVNDRHLARPRSHPGMRSDVRVEMGRRDHGQMTSIENNGDSVTRRGKVDDDIVSDLGHDDGQTKSPSIALTNLIKSDVLHSSPSPFFSEEGPSETIDVGELLPTGQQQKQLLYGSFTPVQLKWLIASIALVSGLLSFTVTTLVCCCMMRRGKFAGPKVNSAKTQGPAKAWTYQDLMPAASEGIALVETPQQKRRVTCV